MRGATTKPFAVGDRVRIVGSHPWTVTIDGTWSDAAVAEADIRHCAARR
jgi:hypothetical protein